MLGVVESVALVLEVSIILILLANLFDKKIKLNIYTTLVVIVYLFVFTEINVDGFPTYIAIIAYAAIFIYSLFIYKKSIRVTMINFFLSFVIGCLIQLIVCIPVHYLYYRLIGIAGLNSLLVNITSLVIVIDRKSVV